MKLCLFSTDRLFLSDSELESAIASLPFGESDRQEILKIKNKRASSESLGARMALMRLCGQRDFGTIEKTETGKPYFSKSDAPFFSLSHTKGMAAAALCNNDEGLVGVDIELISTDRKLSNIAKRFFSPDELLRYENNETPESFYSIWTEKEARVKLFGKELYSELSKDEKEALYFYKYKVKLFETYAILCVASKQEQKEIIFINDEDFEVYGLQDRA